MTDPPRPLTTADIEAIAQRTAELLTQQGSIPQLLDTATVAKRLSVSPDWVRQNAGDLGGLRIGDGKRGPLRFRPSAVERALDALQVTGARAIPRPHAGRRGRRTAEGVELIPLRTSTRPTRQENQDG